MKNLTVLVVSVLLAITAGAEESQLIIAKANKAYSDGLFTNAIENYKEVLKAGNESASLYYNMGNCYYKLNDFASAILYYEKAKKLNPGDEDILFNLKIANNKIADKIEPLPELFYKKWFRGLVELFPVDTWAFLFVLALILALIGGSFYIASHHLLIRKIGFWLAVILVIISVSSLYFAHRNYQNIKHTDEAIIFAPTVTIKSSPDENSIDLFVLHEGTKVQILDNIGSWFEIKIANGSIGWLPTSTIERI